jgi:hypothetical protein
MLLCIQEAWPEYGQPTRLIDLSTTPLPLFVYVATLCCFIDEEREDLIERLDVWLHQCNSNAPQLDQIYQPILHYVLSGSYNTLKKPKLLAENHWSEFSTILGAVILVTTPLSCRAIAPLLSIPKHRVTLKLQNVHAVLSAPQNLVEPI